MDDIGVCKAGCGQSGKRSLSYCGLPRILGRSASKTVLPRPAQRSLALRFFRLLQPKSLVPKASARRSPYLTAWGATGMNRQFPGRNFHPLVICTFVAHQHIGLQDFQSL
jgi:hypothetical protein